MKIPPGPLSSKTAAVLSNLLSRIEQQVNPSTASTPINAFHGGYFSTEDQDDDSVIAKPIRAVITDYDATTGLYAWTEQLLTPYSASDPSTILWTDAAGGRSGTTLLDPAYEANGIEVPIGAIVSIRRTTLNSRYGWIYVFDSAVSDVQIILITGPLDGCYYPGTIMSFNAINCTWEPVEDVWVVDANG